MIKASKEWEEWFAAGYDDTRETVFRQGRAWTFLAR
jgi:hypothetical protein